MSGEGISSPAKTTTIKERNGKREKQQRREKVAYREPGRKREKKYSDQVTKPRVHCSQPLCRIITKEAQLQFLVRPEFSNQLALTQQVTGDSVALLF